MFFGFLAGMSEDSDYTSDISFPVQHQHNSSVHQFGMRMRDYVPYDSFEGDQYDQQRSFDRPGSFEQDRYSDERTLSFENGGVDCYNTRFPDEPDGSFDRIESVDRPYYDRRSDSYDNMYERRDSYPDDHDELGSREYIPDGRDYPEDQQDFDDDADYRQEFNHDRDSGGSRDYYQDSPYHQGRSDTDSDLLSYNSRPQHSYNFANEG